MTSGRAPVSNQGGTGLLPGTEDGAGGAEGGDDEDLPDAEDGAGGAEEDEDDPTDVVVSGVDQSSSPSPPVDAEGQARPKGRPRKRGSRAPKERQLRLPQHFNKCTSLIWRGGKGVVTELFKKLCDNYKKAKAKLEEIAKGRPDSDTRTLTLHQIEEALSDPGDKAFRGVVDKLEKYDYKLYGVKVRI